jgi:hypothetical protein
MTDPAVIADILRRLDRLEHGHAPAPVPERASTRRTPRYVTIDQVESDKRWNLWVEYRRLKILEVAGRRYNRKKGEHPATSQEYFATHEGLSKREFQRWFQVKNTQPVRSPQDIKFREQIQKEIDRMAALPCPTGHQHFPGSLSRSPERF